MRASIRLGFSVAVAALYCVGAFAEPVEFEEVKVEKYGYAMKIPKQFKVEGEIDKTTSWTWMPDVPSQTLFDGNKKGDEQNIASPDPDYKDLEVLDPKKGYAMKDLAYRYKEVDKDKPDEIHRWHVKAFGNKSMYTMGFTGTYEQFKEWGPVFEEAIKSVKLIPLKEEK